MGKPDSEELRTDHSKGDRRLHVYQQLRAEILSLRLAPGAPLDETALSQRHGVSRTPMREALIRLSAEGLVEMQKNSVTRVAPMEVNNLREYHEAAELMHRIVARWAAARATQADLAEIIACQNACEKAVELENWQALLEENLKFHLAIGRASHNKYVFENYSKLLNEGQRFARISFEYSYASAEDRTKNIERVIRDHQKIVENIVGRNQDQADFSAAKHARNGRERLMQFLLTSGSALIPLDEPDLA